MLYAVDFIVSNGGQEATKLAEKNTRRRLVISRGRVRTGCRIQEGKTPTVFVVRELELAATFLMDIHMKVLIDKHGRCSSCRIYAQEVVSHKFIVLPLEWILCCVVETKGEHLRQLLSTALIPVLSQLKLDRALVRSLPLVCHRSRSIVCVYTVEVL